jgi:hypothetical protein
MGEQECKSNLEQLTNGFFFRFWGGVSGFRTNLPRRRSMEYLFKGEYEVGLDLRGSEFTYVILKTKVQISKETSKWDAAPSRWGCDVENSRLHPVQSKQLKLRSKQE